MSATEPLDGTAAAAAPNISASVDPTATVPASFAAAAVVSTALHLPPDQPQLAIATSSSALPLPSVQLYRPADHAHLVLYLAALHGSCITHDGLSGSFAPPLHHEKLLAWWKVRLAECTVLLWLRPYHAAKPTGADLVGAAMLRRHPAETSPHVATVELLLVSPHYRDASLHGPRALLAALEHQALLDRRTLLTAETDADSAAVFTQLGFVEAGRIPGFVVLPSGERRDQVVLYKDLAAPL